LPPIDSSWDEFDPSAYHPEGGIGQPRPPDVTAEGTRELPSPGESGSQAPPSAMVTPGGDLMLTEDAFDIKPVTRPIGPVEFAPGKQSVPYVTVANRFDAGKIVLTPGQEGVVPNSGVNVTLKSVEGTNRVVLIEEGVEYLWVRGRVEWVLTPMDAGPTTEEEMFEAIGSE